MLKPATMAEEVEFEAEPLTQSAVDAFTRATHSQFSSAIPLTFCTIFRSSEFYWLDKLKVDLRNLLHTDMEYEYHSPLKVGSTPHIKTRLTENRERRTKSGSINLYVLETEIVCDQKLAVVARSNFVVRSSSGGE